MDPAAVPRDAFEAMVVDALDSLPTWVQSVVSEIAVLVEDQQVESERRPGVLLLGLYRGVPRTSHYGRAPGTLPDTLAGATLRSSGRKGARPATPTWTTRG